MLPLETLRDTYRDALLADCVPFWLRHGVDTDGRMLFIVTRDGRPVRKRRYVFSEMFAAMASAAYAAAASDGTPTHHAKGSLWKGPFHLPRMHLLCWKLAERAAAGGSLQA